MTKSGEVSISYIQDPGEAHTVDTVGGRRRWPCFRGMEDYVLYPGEIGRGTNSEVHKGRKTVSTCPAMKGQPLERASEQTVIIYFKNQKNSNVHVCWGWYLRCRKMPIPAVCQQWWLLTLARSGKCTIPSSTIILHFYISFINRLTIKSTATTTACNHNCMTMRSFGWGSSNAGVFGLCCHPKPS